MYSAFFGNIVVPIYDLAKGTSRHEYGGILQRTQYFSTSEISNLQAINLRALIWHAYETVPFYHRVFKKRALKPGDIKASEDLRKLPILTKTVIRENFSSMMSQKFSDHGLIPYETGGTGSPLKFYITKEKMSWEIAAEFRAYGWAGYRLGDRCFMLWGARRDFNASIPRRVTSFIERIKMVDPFVMSEEVLCDFARKMQEFNPQVVRGYAKAVYMMAKYLVKNGIRDIRPKTVITGAETLFMPMRKTIEEAFGCDVFDHYGSREIGAIASECEHHEGYHITAENVIVEFVKNGEHVAPGENGTVLLTGLRNYGMPLIRYENGDAGEPSDDVCSCGRGLPLMKSIKGLASQFLAVRDRKTGKIIPFDATDMIEYSMTFLDSPPESYRIIQESLDHIVIKIVWRNQKSVESGNLLVKQLKRYLGQDLEIEIEFVDALTPLPSGKRSPLVSKISFFEDPNLNP